MRRIYTLLADLASCQSLIRSLQQEGVPERHLHVVAGLRHQLEGLPEANAWQKSQLARGISIGALLGAGAGLLAGLLAAALPPAGLLVGADAVAASAAAGACFGAPVSALMKVHAHNHKLDRFHRDIEQGKLLLIVDVSKSQLAAVTALIGRHGALAAKSAGVPA
ncbi:MAG: DUF1269 domain-containing protein [Gammaproteobacteria bacterium]|nr:DUF1269 domain-containing protein [Gammaproteobacteria bacterium]